MRRALFLDRDGTLIVDVGYPRDPEQALAVQRALRGDFRDLVFVGYGVKAPERGWELYQRHCAACHGAQGLGDGAAAYLLHPAPRNLVRGEYRLTSTVNAVPSDADLLAVITRGMPGSGMPPWDRLPEADRLLLVETVRALWRADVRHGYEVEGYDAAEVEEYLAEDTVAGAELAYAAESEPTLSAIGRGRMLFTRTCAPCHGQEGRGGSDRGARHHQGTEGQRRDPDSI